MVAEMDALSLALPIPPSAASGNAVVRAVPRMVQTDATTNWTLGPYRYDGSGNIRAIGSDFHAYDKLGRLVVSADAPPSMPLLPRQTYTYDPYGNLRSINTAGRPTATFEVAAASNRLASVSNGSVSAPVGYDTAGNFASYLGATYEYDALNVMRKSFTGGVTRSYVYTANDERLGTIEQTGSGLRSDWTIRDSGGQVLRRYSKESNGEWKWQEDYIYRGTQMLAAEVPDSAKTRHFHLDHLGTPRLITGNGGAELSRHAYHPFGEEIAPSATTREKKQFTGHERDSESLDYMHARFYAPFMGRFLSVDPLMDPSRNMRMPQRWNRYAYAMNNPLLRVDPDGRKDTIFVVNTSNAGVFNRSAQARLNAAVGGTRFEGRVQVIGPFATAGQVRLALAQADRTDMVAVLGHSGSTKEWAPGKGGMMFAEKKGQWVTGETLAAWASSGAGPGVCMVSGCNSAQLAATVSSGANTTTLGTTANVVGGELGMATAVALGALAQGQSPDAAAAAASQELKTPANHCDGNRSCGPNEVARVVAVPPQ
jgi:RHS repeat-associated protein